MHIEIDISQPVLDQFAVQLGSEIQGQRTQISSELVVGSIQLHTFPHHLELYHFQFKTQAPIHLSSHNPTDSQWLLLNVNLSKSNLKKTVNDQKLDIQRYLPAGILLYTPETRVSSTSPPQESFEIALIRFHRSFLSHYSEQGIPALENAGRAVIYEDLDFESERLLTKSLSTNSSRIEAHANILGFVSGFLGKLKARDTEQYKRLHPQDLKGLFIAAAHLRNPLSDQKLSLEELAGVAGMGITKFKTTFKQVFGKPPFQYHQQVKMEYARHQLAAGLKTPSELSYELGYSHPSKFSTAFKKQFGTSPTGR